MNVTAPSHPRAASADDPTSTNGNKMPTVQGLNNMFLQLLVAQLQHQSPLNPMDPTQFVGQLAQFSELSEITQIDQLLQQALDSSSKNGSSPGSGGQTNPHSATVPATLISSAVAAAQAAYPTDFTPSSISNHLIQGVF